MDCSAGRCRCLCGCLDPLHAVLHVVARWHILYSSADSTLWPSMAAAALTHTLTLWQVNTDCRGQSALRSMEAVLKWPLLTASRRMPQVLAICWV
jgi:hypothetical protein